ncbi:F0F1 ATP synthase subunit B [uncultured Clostridium sp.]|jgi:F-type H+-transporting ATPase subunit b|uniref:F0F1 ATP synthase subunit B n=1 Tax=uncultured Clostridium sp. TaxID=59620 RepID=UPI002609A991|nr:F0F1 ATP synthase subunit B [uncultured Clostridium sp.]
MEFNWTTVVAAIINLGILVLILRYFFWDRIKKAIKERQDAINEKLASADRAREEAAKLKAKNEEILKQAQEEGKRIIAEKKIAAEELYKKIVAEATAEAEDLKVKANEQIGIDVARAQLTLKEQVVDLAIVLSKKAIEGSMDEEKHQAVIDKYIEKVGM